MEREERRRRRGEGSGGVVERRSQERRGRLVGGEERGWDGGKTIKIKIGNCGLKERQKRDGEKMRGKFFFHRQCKWPVSGSQRAVQRPLLISRDKKIISKKTKKFSSSCASLQTRWCKPLCFSPQTHQSTCYGKERAFSVEWVLLVNSSAVYSYRTSAKLQCDRQLVSFRLHLGACALEMASPTPMPLIKYLPVSIDDMHPGHNK